MFGAFFSGEGVAPGPPPPEIKTASSEPERLRLFEEWLQHMLGREGYVVFDNGGDCYVQFAFGSQTAGVHAEIGTCEWEELFGKPMSETVAARLTDRGFQPPEGDNINYWQEFDASDPKTLARLTEWAFQEIFGAGEEFTVKVADFGQ